MSSVSRVYKRHKDHPNHAYAETDPLGGLASYAEVYPVIKLTSEGAVRAAARLLDLPTTIARMNVGYSWTGHGGLPVMQYNTFKEGRPWLAPIGYSNMSSPIGGVDIGNTGTSAPRGRLGPDDNRELGRG